MMLALKCQAIALTVSSEKGLVENAVVCPPPHVIPAKAGIPDIDELGSVSTEAT